MRWQWYPWKILVFRDFMSQDGVCPLLIWVSLISLCPQPPTVLPCLVYLTWILTSLLIFHHLPLSVHWPEFTEASTAYHGFNHSFCGYHTACRAVVLNVLPQTVERSSRKKALKIVCLQRMRNVFALSANCLSLKLRMLACRKLNWFCWEWVVRW